MPTRRGFLHGLGCAICGGLAGSGLHGRSAEAQPAPSADGFFFCETPQITDLVSLAELAADGDDPEIIQFSNRPGEPVEIDLYATARRALRWKKRDGLPNDANLVVLSIGFVDGDAWQQDAVKSHAAEWLRHGIAMDFVFTQERPLIRISFTRKNFSSTGRNALSVGAASATMFLKDVQRTSSEAVVRRVVLHEFGHGAMTMGHEQKHPDAGFQWNEDAIIADTGWSRGDVRSNITSIYGRESVCRGAEGYDSTSVMHYPIKSSWTRDGRTVPYNTTLSPGDIACALSVYS